MTKGQICAALVFLTTLFCLRQSSAQQNPQGRNEFYVGYGFLSNSFNDYANFPGTPMNGWDATFTKPLTGSLGLSIGAIGMYGTSIGAKQIEHSLLLGPKWSSHGSRVSCFVHGLVGIGVINSGAIPYDHSSPSSNVTFAALAGGGIDTSISHNLAWRVEGDYLRSQYGSNSDQIHNLRGNFAHITTGLVYRF